jgi:hypothetical protein
MTQRHVDAGQVPLVGFVPWGLVEGRHALWEPAADGRVAPHTEKMPLEDFHKHEKQFSAAVGHRVKSLRINPNHSHLFLVDDGTVGHFSVEAEIRAAFEVRSPPLGTACDRRFNNRGGDLALLWSQTAFCAADSVDEEIRSRIRETLLRCGLGWQLAHLPVSTPPCYHLQCLLLQCPRMPRADAEGTGGWGP